MVIICRLRGKNKSSSGLSGKQLEKKKSDKMLERQQSRLTRSTPFHRRNQTIDEFVHYDMDMFMPRMSSNAAVTLNAPGVQVASAGSTPNQQSQSQVNGNSETGNVNTSIESPPSNAPSPLEDSHNHTHLENVASMDPTMPTLSPHPPVLKSTEKEVPKISQIDSTISQNVNNNNSSVPVNSVTSDSTFHKPHTVLKLENNSVSHQLSWNQQPLERVKANMNSWLKSQQKQVDHKSFKRPCLPTLDGDQDELVTDSLYNFDSVSNW